MTALATDHTDALELAQARSEVHRLRDLVAACERYESQLQRQLAESHAANQRHIHALEAAGVKIWPVAVYCDGKCGAVVALDPLPEEAALAAVLVALGWSGHRCRRCAR